MLASDVPSASGITSGSAICCAVNNSASTGTKINPPPMPSSPPQKPAAQPATKYSARMLTLFR